MEMQNFSLSKGILDFSSETIGLGKKLPNTHDGLFLQRKMLNYSNIVLEKYRDIQKSKSHQHFVVKVKDLLNELRSIQATLEVIDHKKVFTSQEFTTNHQIATYKILCKLVKAKQFNNNPSMGSLGVMNVASTITPVSNFRRFQLKRQINYLLFKNKLHRRLQILKARNESYSTFEIVEQLNAQ